MTGKTSKDINPDCLIKALQDSKEDIVVFKKIINFSSSLECTLDHKDMEQWKPILMHIIEIICTNREIGKECVLLASHAFFVLASTQCSEDFVEKSLTDFVKLPYNKLNFLDKEYDISDLELFKLTSAYGCLQVNCKTVISDNTLLDIFDVIYRNSIKYTRYTYFAYKILYMWLQKTTKTHFWETSNVTIEHRLEIIIFSNWCNAISDISKHNSTLIFNMYLKIMANKYDGFLEFIFNHCINNVSWQSEVKYAILAEICNTWANIAAITSKDFLTCLCTSLTKNHLRCAGTKVYINILKKIDEEKWKKSVGPIVKKLVVCWESGEHENHEALRVLCKYWLEPTVKKYRNILSYLWESSKDIDGYFFRSYIHRMASEMRVDLTYKSEVKIYMNHNEEIIRLNGFAISCCQTEIKEDLFLSLKRFLWFNANASSVFMRDGIVKYFRMFYINILKSVEIDPEYIQFLYDITNWLYEYLLDCFEMGSCYQRKILGLNLHKAILSLCDESMKSNNVKAFRYKKESVQCSLLIRKHLKETGNWKFTDKKSLFILLKLILDTASDVKETAAYIILNYFDKDTLNDSGKSVLFDVALKNCNSSKFYNTESGAIFVKIVAAWMPLHAIQDIDKVIDKEVTGHSRFSEYLLGEAWSQLTRMKRDVLKAVTDNSPFFGVLTAILYVIFQHGPESHLLTSEFLRDTLDLLENAVTFFLSILSSKSTDKEYSSSFAEMGLAIDEIIKTSEVDDDYDDLYLSSAHQVIISCIWLSLKVSCEIASEIGILMHSDETVKRSIDIIVTVLLKCRHKGAVESAGVAIGNLTRRLHEHGEYVDLAKAYVINLLDDDKENTLNITRRGAGLSIMFHRIVVSDNRRDRPLVHFAVQRLLHLLSKFSNCTRNTETHDSPLARRLHFLRTLVADKEVHAHLTSYMEEIALTCFRYSQSDVWTVRNASLQLFGAIVPRLVGQSVGEISEFGAGYPLAHFITHYPVLANHMLSTLQEFSHCIKSSNSALHLYSNIIHILTLLSKSSVVGCDLVDYSSGEFTVKVKHLLYNLFDNSVIYVRDLSAKAYAAVTSFSRSKAEIEVLQQHICRRQTVNFIHGCLLSVKYLKEKYSIEKETLNVNSEKEKNKEVERRSKECKKLSRLRYILDTWNRMSNGEVAHQPCYIVETMILQLSEFVTEEISLKDIFLFDKNVSRRALVLSSEQVQPGFFQFVDTSMHLYAQYIKRTNSADTKIVEQILDSQCIEQSVAFLSHLSSHVSYLETVITRLLSLRNNDHKLLFTAMITFVINTVKQSLPSMNKLKLQETTLNLIHLKTIDLRDSGLFHLKSILSIVFSKDEGVINDTLLHYLKVSVDDDEYVRRKSVECIQCAIHRFAELGDKNQFVIIQCCVILLKDEIMEIREDVSLSLQRYLLPKLYNVPNISLHKEIIYQRFLSVVVSNRQQLKNFIQLFTKPTKDIAVNATIENPFYHADTPCYREESKFLDECFIHIRCKYHKRYFELNNEQCIDVASVKSIFQPKYQLQREIEYEQDNLKFMLNCRYSDYLSRKRDFVMQELS